jgi:PAS domain S-box-containing protein
MNNSTKLKKELLEEIELLKSDNEKLSKSLRLSKNKLSRMALKKDNNLYKDLFENSPDVIMILREGIIIDCNNKSEEIFGYKKNEIINHSPEIFAPLLQRDGRPSSQLAYEYNLAALKGEPQYFEWLGKKKSGEIVNTFIQLNTITIDNEALIQVTIRDLSALKRISLELEKSKRKLHIFLEQTSEGVSFMTIIPPIDLSLPLYEQAKQYIQNGVITEANQALAEMYGLKNPDEIIGKSLKDFWVGDPEEMIRSMMDWPRANYRLDNKITIEKDSNGDIHYFSNNSIGIFENNHLIGLWGAQREITEQFIINKKIKENEERFRIISEQTGTIVYDRNLITGEIIRTGATKKVLGYEPDEYQAMSLEDITSLLHPDDKYDTIYKEQLAIEKGIDGQLLYRMRHKNGNYVILSDDYVILKNELGDPIRILGSMKDVTLQKEYEEKIIRSEETFRTLITNMTDSFFVLSADGLFKYISPSHKALFGYDEEELMGTFAFNFVHPDDRERIMNMFGGILSIDGARVTAQYKNITKHNGWRIFESIGINLLSHKDINGILINARDVTEKALLDNAVKSLIEGTTSVGREFFDSLVLELSTLLNFKYVFLAEETKDKPGILKTLAISENQKIIENIEYKKADSPCINVIGRTIQVYPENVQELFPNDYDLKIMEAESYIGIPITSSQGKPLGLLVAIDDKPMKDISSAKYLMTLFSERVSSEIERLSIIKELEEKNAELERFTYTVSHDLKSPVITIKGFLGMLKDDAKEGNIERLESDINRISNAADKMQNLLEDLLQLSRIGRLVNTSREFSISTIAEEVIELLQGNFSSLSNYVTIESNMPTVYADKTRIREVIQNLVENSIKYRNVNISLKIDIGSISKEEEIVYFVKDNGIGIKKEYLNKIFGLFEKLNPSSDGTGIGLALVKRIVELHGGKIWAESEGLDKGTTFYFTIKSERGSK